MNYYLAYCGSRCDLCPRYQATLNGDQDQLSVLAELWYRCGWRDRVLSPDEMSCNGCSKTIWCRYGIPGCAAKKGGPNCGVCKSYPSCKRLKEMLVSNHYYDENCKLKCSEEEYEMLRKVCFNKTENLDNARKKDQIK
jgi:hypothetical protein